MLGSASKVEEGNIILINKKGLLLFVLILSSIAYGCNSPTETVQFRKYMLSGHIHMVNDCMGDMSGLPDSMNVAGIFHYKNGDTHELARLGKEVNPVKGKSNEKMAMFMFRVDTNKIGDRWEVTSITNSSGEPVCAPIGCEGGGQCVDTAENNFVVPVEDGGNNPTIVSSQFNIRCECKETGGSSTN